MHQLQLGLDHSPSFKAGSELVVLDGRRANGIEVHLQCSSPDGLRVIPVVFRPTLPGVLKRFPEVSRSACLQRAFSAGWLKGMAPGL